MKNHPVLLVFTFCFVVDCLFAQEPELVIPAGHTDISTSGKFSPDNKFVFTTSHDNSIKVWEFSTGRLVRTLNGHNDAVWYVEFSSDGKLLASYSHGTTIVWKTGTGELLFKLKEQRNPAFSPDDNFLLTSDPNPAGYDSTNINVWSTSSGKLIRSMKTRGRGYINSIKFYPDGKRFLTSSEDNGVIRWDFISGEQRQTEQVILGGFRYGDFRTTNQVSPDGKFTLRVSHPFKLGIPVPRVHDASTGRWLYDLIGHTSYITTAEFSPDSQFIVTASNDNTIKIWEARSGQLLRTINSPIPGVVHFAKFSNDNQSILAGCGHPTLESNSIGAFGIFIWDALTGKLIRSLQGSADNIQGASISSDDKLILISSGNNAKIWEAATGKLLNILEGHTSRVLSSAVSFNGKYIVTGAEDKTVKIWDASGKLTKTLYGHNERIVHISISPNDKFLLTTDYLNSKVWELATGKLLYTLHGNAPSKGVLYVRDYFERHAPQFSDDGNYIVTASDNESIIYETLSGKMVKFYNGHDRLIFSSDFSPDGELVVTTSWDNTCRVWSASTGRLKFTLNAPNIDDIYGFKSAQFSPSGKYIVTEHSSHERCQIVDVLTGNVLHSNIEGQSPRFSTDGQSLITITTDGTIKVWNVASGKLEKQKKSSGSLLANNMALSNIITVEDSQLFMTDLQSDREPISLIDIGRDWVVTHRSGLFDASPGAMDKLYYVQGLDIIDFNQLKERYYEPGLWKKVMAGEELRTVVGMKSIELPPDIQVGQVDGEGYLNINLTNRGGGIGEVNLFVNGKEVIKDARDANIKPDAPNASIKVFVGKHKSIVKGQENLIAVKAWNKDHWVQSRGQIVSYHSKEIESYKPAVHILTCGVSDYTGNEIDLKYAAKDANDMSTALQLGAKKLFGVERSYVYNLTTTQAKEFYPTKTNILKAFDKITSTAHPLDVFVMYVSGHGINYGGQDGDWHYLTQEAYTGSGAAYNDPAIRAQTTISSNELVELFKKVPALKQVLMLDACASGKVVDNLMAQKDIESSTLRALDRMRDRTGMHIITGCTADAVSYEASKYGQGVLTYSLLEGIRGAALREDQYVDVNKLFQYAQDRVPQLAEGIGGIQSPQVFSPQGSQSFDIGLLSDDEKKEIPIAKIRPVFVRSNFQDENELEDVLGLSKQMDEALNEVSSKAVESTLIFVDVREYPEGCKLSGLYKREGGKIVLKLRKRCGTEDKTFDLKSESIEGIKKEIWKTL